MWVGRKSIGRYKAKLFRENKFLEQIYMVAKSSNLQERKALCGQVHLGDAEDCVSLVHMGF